MRLRARNFPEKSHPDRNGPARCVFFFVSRQKLQSTEIIASRRGLLTTPITYAIKLILRARARQRGYNDRRHLDPFGDKTEFRRQKRIACQSHIRSRGVIFSPDD